MKILRHLILFLFLFFLSGALFSQLQKKDSVYYQRSVDSLESLYSQTAGTNLLIYNGVEYIPSPFSTIGDPFFETGDLDQGSVYYDGKLYNHVNLQYDMAKDELVVQYSPAYMATVLLPEKVTYFMLGQHRFIYFPGVENNSVSMPASFYEKLFDDKITLLARKEKKFKLSGNAAENSSSYLEYNYFFLQKEDGWHAVKNQSSLLELVKDKKDQLRKYASQNHISFKKEPEAALLKLIRYYSQLKN
jgi:hypothetical protein